LTNWFKSRNRLQRALVYVAAFFIGLFLLLILFKGSLFSWMLNRQINRLNEQSSYILQIEKAKLEGFSSVQLSSISLCKKSGDSLAYIQDLHIEIRPNRLINRHHVIKSMSMSSGFIRYSRLNSSAPDSLSINKPDNTQDNSNLPTRLYQAFERYFPSQISVSDFHLEYQDSLGHVGLEMENISGNQENLHGKIVLKDDHHAQTWQVSGRLNEGVELEAYAHEKLPLPALYQRFGLDLRSDTLKFSLLKTGTSADGLDFHLSASINDLNLHHPKLSSDTIGFRRLATSMNLSIGYGYIQIDSSSTFTVNEVTGNFGLQAPLSRAGKKYGLMIKTNQLPAQQFFNSLPEGAFDDTRGLKAAGELAYTLRFYMDGAHPDDLIFDAYFTKKDFKIQQYGASRLDKMSAEFEHTVYENDKPFRTFKVGPSNPKFTPIAQVPQNLIRAILVSEDPSFFQHGGFIQEAFRESIATNYKAGSFKRGGSTISMQLIKNVFLSRKKTVFRKMEEALIVWLVEGQHLTNKERMMEVYLNIIEWGPGIYGVNEASHFYFDKAPDQLSLPECIYLANIIPRPKKFKYSFEKDGKLRRYMVDLQTFILRRMLSKEMIQPSDTLTYDPYVQLRGPARGMVVELDTNHIDSLLLDEPATLEIIP